MSTAKRTGAQVRGPIPRKIEKFTVKTARPTSTRSRASNLKFAPTSVFSTSSIPRREQFDALMKLDLAAGVDVEIKL